MSYRHEAERRDVSMVATTKAFSLAKRLGHAVVIARRGKNGDLDVFDSWVPLDYGWVPVAFVSCTGKVVACAETE